MPMQEERPNPHTSFARYLSKFYSNDENHYLLFLKSSTLQQTDQCRSINDVLQSAKQYGFGCILKPIRVTNSIYHNTSILRTFQSMEESNPRSFGEWMDNVHIPMKDVTPVCYGCSFAVKAVDVVQKRDVLRDITKDLERDNSSEVSEFTERAWASIFTYPLSKHLVEDFRKHTDDVKIETCCYTGMMSSNYAKRVSPLWRGDTPKTNIDISSLDITLILSFCDEDISWLHDFFDGVTIQKTIIYSKCNRILPENFPFENVTVVEELNVGRCDHSYARYMCYISHMEHYNPNDIILFFKASRNLHQPFSKARGLKDMIRIAYHTGLGCGLELTGIYSAYYDTTELRTFEKKLYFGNDISSLYGDFGEWLDDLGIKLPRPYCQVCYGGFFAVKAERILGYRDVWKRMERSLRRGDNIEEGHFAERTWAGLLSYPLTLSQVDELKRNATGVTPSYNFHYVGSLSTADF